MSGPSLHAFFSGLLFCAGLVFSFDTGHCELPDGTRLGGHLKSLNLHLESPPHGHSDAGELSSDSLRLDLIMPAIENTIFEFAIEGNVRYADPALDLPLPGASPNRRLDLERSWHEDRWFSQHLAVDRFNLQGSHFGLDWSLGRQAIGFGRINLFSPLDIIAPFSPDALDTEVRPGVDALRFSRYFGLAGQAGTAMVIGQKRELNSYLAFAETNVAGTDLLAIAGQLRERPMIGGGFATQFVGMGIKGEAATYQGQQVGQADGDLRRRFSIAAIEADYRFGNGLMLFAQYLYNGAGGGDPKEYPRVAYSAPVREGLSFLLGRHYLLFAPAYELHPLATLNGLLIWNLRDESWLLRPLLHLSLADNLTLELFWDIAQGTPPQKSNLSPRSEFGSGRNSYGLFIKYFF